jgi:H+/gluconate symporter-like permease
LPLLAGLMTMHALLPPGFGDQSPPPMLDQGAPQTNPIGFLPALLAMLFPLALILIAAVAGQAMAPGPGKAFLLFLGHPFTALMLAPLSVTGWLRVREGAPWAKLSGIMTRALEPAGLMVLITAAALSPSRVALVTIAIGGGATIASHVNDTGFWLVKQCLGLTEAQTFRSWTIGATIAGLTSFGIALLIWPFV